MDKKSDIEIIQEHETPMQDVSTDEVLTLMLGDDENDVVFGRMGLGGLDESEFDDLPRNEDELTPEDVETSDLFAGDDEDAEEPFSSPMEEHFPLYKRALRHFQNAETPTRVVRIDTDSTYTDLVGSAAIKELSRRLSELRTFVEAHVADHHGGPVAPMSEWKDVIGAAEAVNLIRAADTADEVVDAMPQVPLNLPEYAQGKVKCWQDADGVVIVSLRFCAADGTPRYATMAGKPRVDSESVVGWAMRTGANPVTVLGVAEDLAASACGKRLVRDAAGAALQAQRRLDVVGMSDDGDDADPILLTNGGDDESTAPLAALMYVQQLAESGHEQATKEMDLIRAAASTPKGREIAGPILDESTKRLEAGRQSKIEGCWK
jgi:hypothetical protein